MDGQESLQESMMQLYNLLSHAKANGWAEFSLDKRNIEIALMALDIAIEL